MELSCDCLLVALFAAKEVGIMTKPRANTLVLTGLSGIISVI